jgi:hypothetical protein
MFLSASERGEGTGLGTRATAADGRVNDTDATPGTERGERYSVSWRSRAVVGEDRSGTHRRHDRGRQLEDRLICADADRDKVNGGRKPGRGGLPRKRSGPRVVERLRSARPSLHFKLGFGDRLDHGQSLIPKPMNPTTGW